LVNNSHLYASATTGAVRPGRLRSDAKQVSAEMTATLTAELDGRVPPGLVAEIVRSVFDESRQYAPDRGVEMTMLEARQRLERFIRARASR
jgi:hypothetical protein